MVIVKRGDVFLADMDPVVGHEQGGIRPVLIIQNDISNLHSPVTIGAAITSRTYPKDFPNNVFVSKRDSKLPKDSTILLNQLRTIDKSRLSKKICSLDPMIMRKVDAALKVSLSLN